MEVSTVVPLFGRQRFGVRRTYGEGRYAETLCVIRPLQIKLPVIFLKCFRCVTPRRVDRRTQLLGLEDERAFPTPLHDLNLLKKNCTSLKSASVCIGLVVGEAQSKFKATVWGEAGGSSALCFFYDKANANSISELQS